MKMVHLHPLLRWLTMFQTLLVLYKEEVDIKKPDRMVKMYMFFTGFMLLYPFKYIKTRAYFRNLLSLRWEMYTVRDGLYYKHFKTG